MNVLHTNDTDGIRLVTISRPEALNALNKDVIGQLYKVMEEIEQNPTIKGTILTGQGERAFVAGADIKELSELDRQQAYELSKLGQRLFKRIEESAKPVIAAVNGFALGGGCELAMSCHVRVATSNAKFGQPEVNLGIIPGYGGTQRLTQLVGRGKALELLLTGDMLSADDARALGLVNHIYASRDEMLDAARFMLKKISEKGPTAVAQVIRSVNAGFSFEEAGYEAEAQGFAACAETDDFKEGTSAFLEKRKPLFKGK